MNTADNKSIKSFPEIVKSISQIEIEYIDKFLDQIETYHQTEMNGLKLSMESSIGHSLSISETHQSYFDSLINDRHILNEVKGLGKHLAVVALYRVVELGSKKIVALYSAEPPEKILSITTKKIFKIIQDEFRVDLREVPGFTVIDELRCLNNSIKHEGVVSEQLSRFPDWEMGSKIVVTIKKYSYLSGSVPSYLFNLCRKIEENANS